MPEHERTSAHSVVIAFACATCISSHAIRRKDLVSPFKSTLIVFTRDDGYLASRTLDASTIRMLYGQRKRRMCVQYVRRENASSGIPSFA